MLVEERRRRRSNLFSSRILEYTIICEKKEEVMLRRSGERRMREGGDALGYEATFNLSRSFTHPPPQHDVKLNVPQGHVKSP